MSKLSSTLTINGRPYSVESITWSPVEPAAQVVGAVQVMSEFETACDGQTLAGKRDDYLAIDAAGRVYPVPADLFCALWRATPQVQEHVNDR